MAAAFTRLSLGPKGRRFELTIYDTRLLPQPFCKAGMG